MGSMGFLSWDRSESGPGIYWSLVIGSLQVPKEKLDEQFSIGLVAYEWILVMGSIGLLSWDRMDSCHRMIGVLSWDDWTLVMDWNGLLSWDRMEYCHGIDWSSVMGSIGVLSWDRF